MPTRRLSLLAALASLGLAIASCALARQPASPGAPRPATSAPPAPAPGQPPITTESAPPNPSTAPPPAPLPGLTHEAGFFPGAAHDPAIPTPDSILGFRLGDKPVTHAQIESVIKAIANASPRAKLIQYGTTHEGRALYYLVIATPERIARLDGLKSDLARLADPRSMKDSAALDRLARDLPAIAWMAYCIHGDEMSGSDAALAVAHHLAAGQDDDVRSLLENLVVIIDPLMNPDGRDRWVRMIAENRTAQPSVDDQSLLHAGVWPSGRMNHYLFDLNRDWIFATQPETRGRLGAIRDWHPHYFMESHEMGSQDTFLFMPAREPYNPNYPAHVRRWVDVFAAEQAEAFDAHGWRYYTGEWNEEWYPGYSSSWAAPRGAVENLYEQASISTDAVRRPEGTLEPYREAVHKQLVASMANLGTLAANRQKVLADFLADRRAVLADDSPYAQRTFAVVPGANPSRFRVFLDLLAIQGFESHAASEPFRAAARDRLGREAEHEFPAGTILIPNRQPLAHLLAAMLEFDPRMTPEFLTEERRELLRFDRSRLYDITGWSIPMLFDVECYELASSPSVQVQGPARSPDDPPVQEQSRPQSPSVPSPPNQSTAASPAATAFLIDGADDRSVVAAARLMDRGVWVRITNKPTELGGRKFARGSVVVTRKDNPPAPGAAGDALADTVTAVSLEVDLAFSAVGTGMAPGDAPDLGGEHFVLLHPPRIAVLGRDTTSPYSYGQAWHTIDHVLGVRASYLDADQAGGADLRRYNVLVVPEGARAWIGQNTETLRSWVRAGGTLVAPGSSAGALATEKGIGQARLLSEVIAKPDPYIQSVIREWGGVSAAPDPAAVWAVTPPAGEHAVEYPWDGTGENRPSEEELKRRDEWRRIFSPQGVILAARVDDRSWLTAGCADSLPVLFGGSGALVVPAGVQAPVRFGVFSPAPVPPPTPPTAQPDPSPEPSSPKTENREPTTGAAPPPETPSPKPKAGWTIAPPGYELRLRMSGLLWPEAAERLANTAYVTREALGAGQVILFADDPNFRAATLGTRRLFANAVVYGPGMGASQPIQP